MSIVMVFPEILNDDWCVQLLEDKFPSTVTTKLSQSFTGLGEVDTPEIQNCELIIVGSKM